MTSELKHMIELFKRNEKPPTAKQITSTDCLRIKNFVKVSSLKEPIYIAIHKSRNLACLLCLLSEKIDVEFETIHNVFDHIKVTHPHLHDLIEV